MRHKVDDADLRFCPMLIRENISSNYGRLAMGILVFLVSQRLFYNKSTTFCQNNDDVLRVNGPSELQKGEKRSLQINMAFILMP